MPAKPLTVAALAKFHREVVIPDVQRIVAASEKNLRNEMHGMEDAILTRLGNLETEYVAIKIGLKRVEDKLAE